MTKKTDIKSLDVFGARPSLDKIKEYYQNEVDDTEAEMETQPIIEEVSVVVEKEDDVETEKVVEREQVAKAPITTTDNPKGAGAPIRRFDRVYSAKAPIKISTLLNETSRNIVDKYETGQTRDELLRKALDEYIKQNMSLEDKVELHNAVIRDLELFREKEPTVPELDKDKKVLRTVEEIEEQTSSELKTRWGIKQ